MRMMTRRRMAAVTTPAPNDDAPDVLVIRRIYYCRGRTKKGQPCRQHIGPDQCYCSRHARLFKFEKPTECPICLEPSKAMHQPLSCGHWVCRPCVLRWKEQCPVCRSPIEVTKREREHIARNQPPPDQGEDLTEQAVASLMRRHMTQRTDPTRDDDDTMWQRLSEEDGGVDVLSSLIVSHTVASLTRSLANLGSGSPGFAVVFEGLGLRSHPRRRR
jgi:hypothetical protein